MDMKAKGIIANLPATDPAVGKDGPTLGFNAANTISDALESAGYKVVHNDDLTKLGEGIENALEILGYKVSELRPAGTADQYGVPRAKE